MKICLHLTVYICIEQCQTHPLVIDKAICLSIYLLIRRIYKRLILWLLKVYMKRKKRYHQGLSVLDDRFNQ